MRFFAISAGFSSKYPSAVKPIGTKGVMAACPRCHRSVPVNIRASGLEASRGGEWPDILTSASPFAVSERSVSLWNSSGFSGFNTIPIEVECKGRGPLEKKQAPKYFQLLADPWAIVPIPAGTILVRQWFGEQIQPIRGPLQMLEFGDVCISCGWEPDNLEAVYAVAAIDFDISTWNGSDFFTWRSGLYCTERVIRASLAAKLTNLRWVHTKDAGNTSAPSLTKLPV